MARRAGRYLLHDAIASGGMASVHLGRVVGTGGFSRIVAVKRLHAHLAGDPEFADMFLDEARLASRIHHPNVVATLDVVNHEGELMLVMEYVLGESWWHLLKAVRTRGEQVPLDVVSAVVVGLLQGLHAAHEARSQTGEPLDIVHRDVSPHNVLVGVDGIARVVDFGIAKAVSRVHSTQGGELKGKLAYMAPEQIKRGSVDRRADVYAAAVVLWESLTSARLFKADDAAAVIAAVLEGDVAPPSTIRRDLPKAVDALVMRGLAVNPEKRFATALEMASELERVITPATPRAVEAFVSRVAATEIEARRMVVAAFEQIPSERLTMDAIVDSMPPSAAAAARSPEERKALAAAETQVSMVGATEPPAEQTEKTEKTVRDRRGWVIAALAFGAMAIAGGAYAMKGTGSDGALSAPAAAPASEPSTSTTTTTTTTATPTPTPTPTPTSTPTPAAEPPVGQPAAAGATPSAVVGTPPLKRRAKPAAAKASDCNPNFTVDANGVKRFKPHCI